MTEHCPHLLGLSWELAGCDEGCRVEWEADGKRLVLLNEEPGWRATLSWERRGVNCSVVAVHRNGWLGALDELDLAIQELAQ